MALLMVAITAVTLGVEGATAAGLPTAGTAAVHLAALLKVFLAAHQSAMKVQGVCLINDIKPLE
jgi:hypothetical protein